MEARSQFLTDVDAEHIASEARHKGIVPEKHETRIKKAESVTEANEILFTHLLQQATLSNLEDLCQIMISANGYAKMMEFGQKLLIKVSVVASYCVEPWIVEQVNGIGSGVMCAEGTVYTHTETLRITPTRAVPFF